MTVAVGHAQTDRHPAHRRTDHFGLNWDGALGSIEGLALPDASVGFWALVSMGAIALHDLLKARARQLEDE